MAKIGKKISTKLPIKYRQFSPRLINIPLAFILPSLPPTSLGKGGFLFWESHKSNDYGGWAIADDLPPGKRDRRSARSGNITQYHNGNY
jgi:hypothetical protein